MTSAEQLKDIEKKHIEQTKHKELHLDCGRCWLINHVKRLTQALEEIKFGHISETTMIEIARKALEEK